MGLTYEEAKRCGLAHLWPTESKPLPDAPPPPSKAPKDGMTKLERDFWERAEAFFGVKVFREPMKLRLAGRCFYTPDFLIDHDNSPPAFWEVKGPHAWEDSIVKLKTAAERYGGIFDFILATRPDVNRWECREVTRAGISKSVWCPAWLS